MTVLGLDIGGTKIAVASYTAEGQALEHETATLAGRGGAEVGALAAELLRRVRARTESAGHAVAAAGAIIPGIWYADRGRAWAPNIPGWDDYPLLDELRDAAGGIPVAVDSDRAGYILGEAWLGEARGCRDAVFIAVGTGIGSGILVDGRILRGARDIAGASGWLALDRPFRKEYADTGCFEHRAAGPGIVRAALARVQESEAGSLLRSAGASLTTADVFAAADGGDATAASVIDDAIAYWGMAVANHVSLFDPEVVVFGGGVFGPAARYIDRIREEALRWAQPISMPRVRLAVSTLGGSAGLLGAGHLALRTLDPENGG
ncbi:MAG TPA: ROK family protein [Longimicrobiales bacterium]|nr:ROK family protein [Longimicrobiales bacterium]